tara:strand:+ start:570 stop:800 length:231 start_codon:yes stop_codon:yes gene_type:complete
MDLTILFSLARSSILVDKADILLSMVVSWDCASLSQVLRQAVMRMRPASWASMLGPATVVDLDSTVVVLIEEEEVP